MSKRVADSAQVTEKRLIKKSPVVSEVPNTKPRKQATRTRRKPTSDLPAFSDGLEFVTYTLNLEQEVHVYKSLVEYLDQFIDPDIGEPKVMPCHGRFVRDAVDQQVIISVQSDLRQRHSELLDALNKLLRKGK